MHYSSIQFSTYTFPFQTGFDIHFTFKHHMEVKCLWNPVWNGKVSNRVPHTLFFHTVFQIHFPVSNRVPNTLSRFKQCSTYTFLSYRVSNRVPHAHTLDHFNMRVFHTHFTVSNRVPHTLSFHTVFHTHFTVSTWQGSTFTLLSNTVWK